MGVGSWKLEVGRSLVGAPLYRWCDERLQVPERCEARPVERGDLLDVELEPLDVAVEVGRKRIHCRRRRRVYCERRERVTLDQDLLGRQPHHGERVVVATAG